jgi:hypothetical protein
MTANGGRRDDGYYEKSPGKLRNLVDNLIKQGHEVGFHASYASYLDKEKFMIEKTRMDKILGSDQYGGRQHYLCFSVPETWRLWEEARIKYDSTLGYADHEGFRCGTCYQFHPFDLENDREMELLEIPLIVMDGTLKQYRGFSPKECANRILFLAKRCQEVGGMFTLLWHNTSIFGEWYPWFDQYKNLLPKLKILEED